jgi:hypothetical protein
MKNWIAISLSLLVIRFIAPGVGLAVEIGGIWTKTTHPDANNISLFYEEMGKVKAVGQGRMEGREVLWFGEGEIKDGRIHLTYHYSADAIPTGWEPDGTMDLKISEDGKTMRGTARSASGNWAGPIEFRRIRILLSPISSTNVNSWRVQSFPK